MPNERSSHTTPTPHGGGVAIVFAYVPALALLFVMGSITWALFTVLAVGGAAVAVLGFVDDRFGVAPPLRLVVHLAAGAWTLWWLGGLPPLVVGERVVELGWSGFVLGSIGVAWTLNAFNFMDGIDGIAASEASFIVGGAVFICWLVGAPMSMSGAAIVFVASCCGFLVWNWAPAKIFMGDVGSGFLGYVVSSLAIAAGHDAPQVLWAWFILGGVFCIDATTTLVVRLSRGEKPWVAHRSHAYQRLARLWRSHARVTSAVLALNLLWLLPCGWAAAAHPSSALWIALTAVVPLLVTAVAIGAGSLDT